MCYIPTTSTYSWNVRHPDVRLAERQPSNSSIVVSERDGLYSIKMSTARNFQVHSNAIPTCQFTLIHELVGPIDQYFDSIHLSCHSCANGDCYWMADGSMNSLDCPISTRYRLAMSYTCLAVVFTKIAMNSSPPHLPIMSKGLEFEDIVEATIFNTLSPIS